jgi:hypothetical protein
MARQQTEGLVAAFREGRPADVDYRPTCPMDGEPLSDFHAELGQPAWYQHADGTRHRDRMADLTVHAPQPARVTWASAEPELRPGEPVTIDDRATGHTIRGTVTESGGVRLEPEVPEQPSTADLYMQRVGTAMAAGVIDPNKLITGVGHITRNDWRPEQPPAERAKQAAPMPPPAGPIYENGDGS